MPRSDYDAQVGPQAPPCPPPPLVRHWACWRASQQKAVHALLGAQGSVSNHASPPPWRFQSAGGRLQLPSAPRFPPHNTVACRRTPCRASHARGPPSINLKWATCPAHDGGLLMDFSFSELARHRPPFYSKAPWQGNSGCMDVTNSNRQSVWGTAESRINLRIFGNIFLQPIRSTGNRMKKPQELNHYPT